MGQLKPGTLSDFSESMAQAMEEALRHHWQQVMGGRPIPFSNQHLRVFLVGIAQGVVRHLVEHPTSFQVHVSTSDGDGSVTLIDQEGTVPAPREST